VDTGKHQGLFSAEKKATTYWGKRGGGGDILPERGRGGREQQLLAKFESFTHEHKGGGEPHPFGFVSLRGEGRKKNEKKVISRKKDYD